MSVIPPLLSTPPAPGTILLRDSLRERVLAEDECDDQKESYVRDTPGKLNELSLKPGDTGSVGVRRSEALV